MTETVLYPLPQSPVGPATTQSNRERAARVARPASIENSLLAALPRKEHQRLLARLEPVTLTFGEVLYEPGETIRHVYFPSTSLVSLLTLVDGHLALEVGLLGRDGGSIAGEVELALVVASAVTSHVQEAHITIIHLLCELVERAMTAAQD